MATVAGTRVRGWTCRATADSEGDDEDEEDEDEDDEGSERRIHSTEMDCEGQLAEGCARKGS